MEYCDQETQTRIDPYSHWRRNVWVMATVQVLLMMGVTLVNPLLPLFLEDEFGLRRGADVELWAGLIASANFMMTAISSPFWGAMADRYGRKLMVIRSSAAVGVFNLLMSLAGNVYELFAIRLAMGLFSGFGAAAVALVGASTPEQSLGWALGMLNTGQVIGVVVGPLLGGVISTYFGYRAAFVSTGILALLGCLVAWVGVRENFDRSALSHGGNGRSRLGFWQSLRIVTQTKELLPMFAVLILTSLAIGGVLPILSLFVGELAVPANLVPIIAGLVFSVTGIGSGLAAPFLGRAADRWGYRRILLLSLLGASVFFFPQAFVSTATQFLVLRFLLGLFVGGIMPATNALIGRLAPSGQQSAAYGLTFSATSIGNFLGPVLGSLVARSFGLAWVFLYTGTLLFLNAAWVFVAVREPRSHSPKPSKPI